MESLEYGKGIYRRRIRLVASPGAVRARLEDDFHHFGVTLHHDGERVSAVDGQATRYPWTTCAEAVVPLQDMAGLVLSVRVMDPARSLDPRRQCTHLFDLACLAFAHAGARRDRRQYDVEIPDRRQQRTTMRLRRDGEPVLAWEVEEGQIVSPAPFAGRSLAKGFPDWAEATLDPELAEAAIVLRRASAISIGRAFPLDRIPRARELASRTLGACYSFSPGIIERGERMYGTSREFSHTPDRLLSGGDADLET